MLPLLSPVGFDKSLRARGPHRCKIPPRRGFRPHRRRRHRRSPRADSRCRGIVRPSAVTNRSVPSASLHDAEAALVQQPMVMRAEQRHVVGRSSRRRRSSASGDARRDSACDDNRGTCSRDRARRARAAAASTPCAACARRRAGCRSSSSTTVTRLQSQSSRLTVSIGRSARPAPPRRDFASACTTT